MMYRSDLEGLCDTRTSSGCIRERYDGLYNLEGAYLGTP